MSTIPSPSGGGVCYGRRMALTVVPLENKHLEDAAHLVANRYRLLHSVIAELPPRYEDAAILLPLLTKLTSQAPGVAALQAGRLAGFLTAWLTPDWRGERTVYSPEWANGADEADQARIYQEMYAALSAQWVADRYFEHFVTLFATDDASIAAWQQMGFGHVGLDAIRDLSPLVGVTSHIEIRRATTEDWPAALALWKGLQHHLGSPPTFLVDAVDSDPHKFEAWLRKPANALWLGCQEGRVIGSLGIGPASNNACTIIRDEGTASIASAFTLPEARGGGVATALLSRALEWARQGGYVRCSVDCETANLLAMRFWPRHFRPICHSLGRHVNPRIALLNAVPA